MTGTCRGRAVTADCDTSDIRPFGALLLGHIGDLVGRKYTFIITITCMGLGTFLIGLLPSFATAGIIAPILLIALRLLQGVALGGR
jgi:MFS family permease